MEILLSFWWAFLLLLIPLFLMIGVPIIITKKQRKEKELYEKMEKERHDKLVSNIEKFKKLTITDLLNQNELQQYCEIFE